MEESQALSALLGLPEESVRKAIALLDSGLSVPFLARYRKEETGGLSDENLRDLAEKLSSYRALEERKKTILNSLSEQGVQDPSLLKEGQEATSLSRLEDLYRPYRPKKVTRGSKARKAGLKPLSLYLLKDRSGNLMEEARKYVTAGFETPEKAVQGALDILAEEISDNPNYRTFLKAFAWEKGILKTEKAKDSTVKTYDHYENFSCRLKELRSYQVLAINRGVNEKVLSRSFVWDDDVFLRHVESLEIPSSTPYRSLLSGMVKDSYERLIRKSVQNDLFSDLMEKASDVALGEFKSSLKATLLYPPLRGKRILGFDPGFRNGCKLASIDENGKVLSTAILENPFTTDSAKNRAILQVASLLKKDSLSVIALGNGTASRESFRLLKEMKESRPETKDVQVIIVPESGASVWSATEAAQKEFPDFSPNLRSAVSLARRLEDPLAELVKIPPESLGVGLYQHDLDPKKLSLALSGVVEDCVNYVGVEVNTASPDLLSHVSGIGPKLAQSIVDYREKNGPFQSRSELRKVNGLGPKAFENAAGFLRIPDSKEPLDNTAVHPESYPVAKKLYSSLTGSPEEKKNALKALTPQELSGLSEKLNVGLPTLTDIVKELVSPSRDPRLLSQVAYLDENVNAIGDLKPGMVLEGTVRNVTPFGFFVDIGVEKDGLVHVSQMEGNVRDPHLVVKPGVILKVKVVEVDLKRNRISLSTKGLTGKTSSSPMVK